MSRFSVFVHQHFGSGTPNETVADILVRRIPDTAQLADVKEVIADAVAVMEGTGLPGEQKKMLVTKTVTFVLASMHIALPAALVSWLIEEAVVLLKHVQPQPTPAPTPVDDPSAIEYDTLDAAKAATSPTHPNVIQKADGKFVVWPQIGPFPGTKVWPIE